MLASFFEFANLPALKILFKGAIIQAYMSIMKIWFFSSSIVTYVLHLCTSFKMQLWEHAQDMQKPTLGLFKFRDYKKV